VSVPASIVMSLIADILNARTVGTIDQVTI